MMYLSRVEIDFYNRKKIRDLTHLGAYHNWVESCFPEEREAGDRSSKLWRLDRINQKQFLLMVSEAKPDLIKLEKYGVPGTAASRNYQPFLDNISDGMKANFRVVLNPVVSVPSPGAVRGRVVPHVTTQQQLQFFLDRAPKYGILTSEAECAIVSRSYELLRKGGKELRLSRVAIQGSLTVTDAQALRIAMTEGIGKKKAYGFGMLTIIPIQKTHEQ